MDKSGKPAHRPPKAYQDTRFLESKDARALRILAEYMEPLYGNRLGGAKGPQPVPLQYDAPPCGPPKCPTAAVDGG